MQNHMIRASVTVLNLVLSSVMVLIVLSSLLAQNAVADPGGGCGDEQSTDNCMSTGQLCCNGVCYDPSLFWCDCEGQVQPLENSED